MNKPVVNFSGKLNDTCEHCGTPQENHIKTLGIINGKEQYHRYPCEAEKNAIRKNALKQGHMKRLLLSMLSVWSYLYGKIPFISAIKLTNDLLKNISKSFRAIIFMKKIKNKTDNSD